MRTISYSVSLLLTGVVYILWCGDNLPPPLDTFVFEYGNHMIVSFWIMIIVWFVLPYCGWKYSRRMLITTTSVILILISIAEVAQILTLIYVVEFRDFIAQAAGILLAVALISFVEKEKLKPWT